MRGGARGLNPSDNWGSAGGAPSTGSAVDIIGTDGKFVARGLYDAKSAIAVRVVTLDRGQPLDAALVRSRIALGLRARRGTIDAATTTAFRWLNGEGDFLPGVVIDVYGTVAILRLDGDAVRVWRDWIVAAIVDVGRTLGITHVYERSRGGRGEALHGGEPPSPIEIREHDVRFTVDIMKGQKTGFFLDQRENRRAIRAFAGGVDVVNLFGYTGGFSVNAALAGARRVTTVDVAAPALVDARANFALNGIDPALHGLTPRTPSTGSSARALSSARSASSSPIRRASLRRKRRCRRRSRPIAICTRARSPSSTKAASSSPPAARATSRWTPSSAPCATPPTRRAARCDCSRSAASPPTTRRPPPSSRAAI
ncbi:MAG TPA: class I SAM-dependent methyltransferase [Polyangia bacterium]|nr:class I SAM-dependent methyltransferase [Polyangia bacterium]